VSTVCHPKVCRRRLDRLGRRYSRPVLISLGMPAAERVAVQVRTAASTVSGQPGPLSWANKHARLHLHRMHGYHAALNEPTSDVAHRNVRARMRQCMPRTRKCPGGGALHPVGFSAGGTLRRRPKEPLSGNFTANAWACMHTAPRHSNVQSSLSIWSDTI
jgi:hypothetical protein